MKRREEQAQKDAPSAEVKFFQDRAKNGSEAVFRQVLDNAPDVPPEEWDRLDS